MANVPHGANRHRIVTQDEIPDGNRLKTARQRRARDDGLAPPGTEEQEAPQVQVAASAEAGSLVGSGDSPGDSPGETAEPEEGPSAVMPVLAGAAAVIGWAAVSAGGGMRMAMRDARLNLPDDGSGARGSRPGERPTERPTERSIERSTERPMRKALQATPVEEPDLPTMDLVSTVGSEGRGSSLVPSFDEDGPEVLPVPQWIDEAPGDGRHLESHAAEAMLSDPELRKAGAREVRLVRRHAHGHEGDDHRVPVEVAGTLALRLRNDTGNTPQQKIDRITSDATVEALGVDGLTGALEYRIDAGSWQALGGGKVIGDAQFDGDGRHRVDLRSLDSDMHPLQAVSLEFEVDRTAPDQLPLRVVHPLGYVGESGARLAVTSGLESRGYVLTNQAKVELPGLEEGAVWYANRYDERSNPVTRESVIGDSRMLPEALFREGPQIIGVHLRDRAGNKDRFIRTEKVFLDTTPPPKPGWWTFLKDVTGMESLLLKEPESGAHFEHRSDPESAWTRLASLEGSLAGPLELRQVDLAGNASAGSMLAAHQTLILSVSSLVL